MTKTNQAYTRTPKKTTPVLPSRLVRLLYEVRWIALGAILISLGIILATYSKEDPGWSLANNVAKVHNAYGHVGAWVADLMFYIFGLSAWWWCIFLAQTILQSYRRIKKQFFEVQVKGKEPTEDSIAKNYREMMVQWAGFLCLLIGSLGIEYIRLYSIKIALPTVPGGVLGHMIGGALENELGFTGATLVLLFLFVVGCSLFFQISWISFVEKVGAAVENSIIWIKNRYVAREDRKVGQEAAVKREAVVVQERAKIEEAAPIHIEPQIVEVQKSERIQKEKQTTLFKEMSGDLPPLSLLDDAPVNQEVVSVETLEFTSRLIEKKLSDFGVQVKVVAAYPGPVVTRYEIEPATGVKGSQIVNLSRDLARSLALTSIRVVETIPGKNYMGLELPNAKRQIVRLTEILSSKVYNDSASLLTVALGKDIAGNPIVADLAKMPHLLIAGTTGSGKSVGINATILSLLYKADPSQVRLIMVDPKMLELSIYEGIPHLLAPVVTDMHQAGYALNWAVSEMERRYKYMSKVGVRNLAGYNQKIAEADKKGEKIPNPFSLTPDDPEPLEKLPHIVIFIDELADLMMVVGKKVEELIARIAQKARAAGIHLILATQRPSVDVITGLIKANVPTRIAFQVSSKIDSRTILDQSGAETLLGMGDMLYMPPGTALPIRVHGAFVSDDEVHRVVDYLKEQGEPNYVEGILEANIADSEAGSGEGGGSGEGDELYDQAVAIVLKNRRASISLVQRHLRIGYNRAARLLEQMEQSGVVSSMHSNGSRDILVPEGNHVE